MYLRRAVSKTLALPRRAPGPAPLGKDASLRRMSSSKPGPFGANMTYYLVVGVTISAGGYYTYKTVTSEQPKHTDHVTNLREKPKAELHPLPGDQETAAAAQEACSEALEVPEANAEESGAEDTAEAAAGLLEEASAWPGSAEVFPLGTTAVDAEAEPEVTEAATAEPTEVTSRMSPEVTQEPPDDAEACRTNSATGENQSPRECEEPEEELQGDSEPSAGLELQEEAQEGSGVTSEQG
uniref:Protein MGARP N-terminal domain-containing protein n=1 Tax=Castor canadensis TaxID=51338 RepID=A0A8C0W6H3_CASCN|nr:protein MGARP [Castor canadensis]